HDVGFLESIGANEFGPDLAGNKDYGFRIHVGIGNGSDQVGCPGARGGNGYPRFAGGQVIALCGVAGTLLVTHENVTNPRGIHEWVVGEKASAAWEAEDTGDVETYRRANNGRGDGHEHR